MTICVMSELNGDKITIHANSAKMTLSLQDAYRLKHHLAFTLNAIIEDAVMKERLEFITARYKP